MQVLGTIVDFRRARRQLVGTLGLVPTMGALHEGHLALVRRARAENDFLAVSIFVNPSQFGPDEDLAAYPRDMPRDLSLLDAEGVDTVFAPRAEEMFPPGFDSWVDVGALSQRLEGEHRPGHFRGVTTVVAKLFNIVRPDRAYFGQKDGQQATVIKRMVTDFAMGVDMVVVPTVRESDGLALSSRNAYLTPEQRAAGAPVVYAALSRAQHLWEAGGARWRHVAQGGPVRSGWGAPDQGDRLRKRGRLLYFGGGRRSPRACHGFHCSAHRQHAVDRQPTAGLKRPLGPCDLLCFFELGDNVLAEKLYGLHHLLVAHGLRRH